MTSSSDVINDVLDRGQGLGFEQVPGFATHWPMGAEALIALGHPDQAGEWVEQFKRIHRHYDRPVPVAPIDPNDETDWRAALGDFTRISDWVDLFRRQLAEASWNKVLVRWWPRLLPGIAAGLTHGMLRTVHVVRSIDRVGGEASDLQQLELADGLSYWAARYTELPTGRGRPTSALPGVLSEVPRLPADCEVPMRERGFFRHVADLDGWEETVGSVDHPQDVQVALSDLTSTFCQAVIAHPKTFPIPMMHTVTAPSAVRMVLPHLPEELHHPSYVAMWRVNAALLTTFESDAIQAEVAGPDDDAEVPDRDELVARVVEYGDDHGIKFLEACLREHALRPDPRYLAAPLHVLPRLPRFYRRGASRIA